MPPYLLADFEIQKYYQNEPKFNGVRSRNNLPKVNVMDLDVYESIGTNWIALYVNAENLTCFDSFRVEHIPKQIRKFNGNKNIAINILCVDAFVLDLLISCEKVEVY